MLVRDGVILRRNEIRQPPGSSSKDKRRLAKGETHNESKRAQLPRDSLAATSLIIVSHGSVCARGPRQHTHTHTHETIMMMMMMKYAAQPRPLFLEKMKKDKEKKRTNKKKKNEIINFFFFLKICLKKRKEEN